MVAFRILLVEDNSIEAMDLKKTLESFGYSVPHVASRGEDAVKKAFELMPDIILMDIILKGDMTGIDAAQEIKELKIPIIYLTAHSDEVTVQKTKLTHPYGYLIKPYDSIELKYAIELAIYRNKMEKELKKSENYYKAIFEHTGTSTVIIEANTIISLANSEFEKLSRYSREEIQGKKSWTEFVDQDDLERMEEYHRMRRVDPGSAPLTYDFRFIDRQGDVKNIYLDIGMIPGTKKSVASLLDITALKKSQAAVKISEKKYRALFDNAADGIFLMRGDRFIQCNDKSLEIYGVKREHIINHTPYSFSPELQDNGESSKENALKLIKQALAGHPQHFEWKHLRYDGTPFYAEVSLNRLKIEGEYLIQAIVRDVTESKQAKKALKKSEEKYRNALDNMMEGCQIISPEWRYLYINNTAASQGHFKKEQLLNHTMMEMYPGIEDTDLFKVLQHCMEERKSHHMDNKFIYPDGKEGWFELSIHPVPEGIFILSVDITERVQREEEIRFKNTLLEEKIQKQLKELNPDER